MVRDEERLVSLYSWILDFLCALKWLQIRQEECQCCQGQWEWESRESHLSFNLSHRCLSSSVHTSESLSQTHHDLLHKHRHHGHRELSRKVNIPFLLSWVFNMKAFHNCSENMPVSVLISQSHNIMLILSSLTVKVKAFNIYSVQCYGHFSAHKSCHVNLR